MHLVVDRVPTDPVVAEMVEGLAVAVPDGTVCVELVDGGDTVAAGQTVAGLALAQGPAGRVVAHDVASADGDPGPWPDGSDDCFCVARSRTGVLVVGPNAGWTWAAALTGLTPLFRIDVTAAGAPPHAAGRLAVAVRHAVGGHPHTVASAIDPRGVPVRRHA